MAQKQFDKIKKHWSDVARNNTPGSFTFELEVHQKLLNVFHAGNYYYYVFNCATAQIEYVSASVKNILGFEHTDELTTAYLVNNMHPDDRPWFFEFEARVVAFLLQLAPGLVMKYKMCYDYRVKRKDGQYIRILQQSVTIQSDEHGAVIRSLGIHTDITHIKKEGKPALAYIGLDGEPSYYDVQTEPTAADSLTAALTPREKQVLELIMLGKTSGQIATNLSVSKLTVDKHRQNLLRKTNSNSVIDLTLKMLQESLAR